MNENYINSLLNICVIHLQTKYLNIKGLERTIMNVLS